MASPSFLHPVLFCQRTQELPLLFSRKKGILTPMKVIKGKHYMNIAVVGCGDWGKNIARTLHSLDALYAVSDHHLDSHKAIQCATDGKVPLESFDRVLKHSMLHGVCIATPPHTHFDIAKQALEAGKHVFVEKPLVLSIEEGKILEALAKEKGRVLMVGHLLRYHQAFQTLERWVKQDKLGSVLHINTSRKNLGKIYPHDNVIWDLAPHDLSMILALIPHPVESILATGANYAVPTLADEAMLSLTFQGTDQKAFITLSRLSPFKEQKLTVVGTKGMAVFDDTLGWDRKLTFFNNTVTQEDPDHFSIQHDRIGTPAILRSSEPLKTELAHFVACLQERVKPHTPARDAIEILSIINAAHQSIKTGGWVKV
jgi:UDP-2-acetamido-3-amino-2,3-dideoxy-glucuronate N-acetyltransferase